MVSYIFKEGNFIANKLANQFLAKKKKLANQFLITSELVNEHFR